MNIDFGLTGEQIAKNEPTHHRAYGEIGKAVEHNTGMPFVACLVIAYTLTLSVIAMERHYEARAHRFPAGDEYDDLRDHMCFSAFVERLEELGMTQDEAEAVAGIAVRVIPGDPKTDEQV